MYVITLHSALLVVPQETVDDIRAETASSRAILRQIQANDQNKPR